MGNKFFKTSLGLIFLSAAIFGFYLYKLHTLAVEGNNIYSLRCTRVNPPLIAYKNSFLKFADGLKNPKSYTTEQTYQLFIDYIDYMRLYVPAEDAWLATNEKFINRWDFQLFEPYYIKQAADYEQKMYEGYRDNAKYLLEITDSQDANNEALTKKVEEARDKRNDYSQLYFDYYEKMGKIVDWRKIFGAVPIPEGCTEERVIIPDTTGALDETPSPAPAVEGIAT